MAKSLLADSPVPSAQVEVGGGRGTERDVVRELNEFMNSLTEMLKENPEKVKQQALTAISFDVDPTPPPLVERVSPPAVQYTAKKETTPYIDLTGFDDLLAPPTVADLATRGELVHSVKGVLCAQYPVSE